MVIRLSGRVASLQESLEQNTGEGKQLSHLEGRLSELERMLKESRAAESALQGQVSHVACFIVAEFPKKKK
jgi:predicted RNase H-like nuclease (RuvC/YqgF family)